jgi:hypothetical protein
MNCTSPDTRFRRPHSASLHVNGIYVRRRLVIALTGVASLFKLNRRGLIDPWQRRCNPGHSSCEVLLLLLTAGELVLPTSSLAGQTSTLCCIPSVKRCSLSYSTSKVVLPCFFVCAHQMPSGCKPVYLRIRLVPSTELARRRSAEGWKDWRLQTPGTCFYWRGLYQIRS